MRSRVEAEGELGRVAAGVVDAVLGACEPGVMTLRAWPPELDSAERVVLIAAGKGAIGMVRAAMARLGDRVDRGVVIGPASMIEAWADRPAQLEVFGADHPLATTRNVEAATRALEMARTCGGRETLLSLISGGASAYLTLPDEGVALDDVRGVTRALLRAGAAISELNSVRKRLDRVKGGGLARAGGGAGEHWSLILSDVLGDPLDVIGSGPTALDTTTYHEAMRVLERYGQIGSHPRVEACLRQGAARESAREVDASETIWSRVRHRVVGNNAVAVEHAAGYLRGQGFDVVTTRGGVSGEAREVGAALADRVLALRNGHRRAEVWGGETTVSVGKERGVGGRCQELALSAACALSGVPGVGVIAFGTDGVDGPTDAAGGVVDGDTASRIRAAGLSPEEALERHDSRTALGQAGALIRTGVSGTNVIDVMIGVSLA